MAKNAASAVIVTGLTRIDAALRIASIGVSPSACRSSWAKSVISTVLATLMPTMKMNPSSDCTLTAVPVKYSIGSTPIRHSGTTSMTVSGTINDLSSADHQEVDQDGRHDQAEAQVPERVLHPRVLAAEHDLRAL